MEPPCADCSLLVVSPSDFVLLRGRRPNGARLFVFPLQTGQGYMERNMKPWTMVGVLTSALTLPSWAAQAPGDLPPLPYFVADQPNQPIITSDIMAVKPFSVVGPRGALLGQQDGSFEAWIFPWKILSHMR